MLEVLPKDVAEGLRQAQMRKLAKQSRIRVQAGDDVYPVLKLWKDGFAMDAETAPHLRGLVDLFDGSRQLSQCLIVASSEDRGLMNYDFKRNTATAAHAARDFVEDENAPIGLLQAPDA